MTLLLILLGLSVLIALAAYFFSGQSNPMEKAKEAARMGGISALFGLGCLVQAVLSAVPIALAILLVLWVMEGCS